MVIVLFCPWCKDNDKETVNYNKQSNLLMTYIGHGITIDITELGVAIVKKSYIRVLVI